MSSVRSTELENLRRNDARYRSLLRASTSIVWITDAAGLFVELQPDWERYTGQSWDQYRESKWISAIHPDDRARITEDWTKAVGAGSDQYRTQGRVWSAKHNRWRAFQTRAVSVRNDAGNIVEWVGALTDVQDAIDAARERDEALADLKRSVDAMEQLRRAGATLFADASSFEAILLEILDAAMTVSGSDFATIQLLEPGSCDLRIAVQRGFPPWWLDLWNVVAAGRGTCGTALERGERVVVEDIERESDLRRPLAGGATARRGPRGRVDADGQSLGQADRDVVDALSRRMPTGRPDASGRRPAGAPGRRRPRPRTGGRRAATERGTVPDPRRHDAAAGVVREPRRAHPLVQPALVRVHGDDARAASRGGSGRRSTTRPTCRASWRNGRLRWRAASPGRTSSASGGTTVSSGGSSPVRCRYATDVAASFAGSGPTSTWTTRRARPWRARALAWSSSKPAGRRTSFWRRWRATSCARRSPRSSVGRRCS